MRKTQSASVILAMALFCVLTACGAPEQPVAPTPTDEPAIQTAEAKLGRATAFGTPRTIPTAPISNLPPVAATSPPSGIVYAKWTAAQIGAAFKSAGLEFEQPVRMTPKDYGLAPLLCNGTHFYIPSLCSDCGARLYECDQIEDRDRLSKFYLEVAKGSAILFSWVYVRDNIVLVINGDLPEAKARKYQAALEGMR